MPAYTPEEEESYQKFLSGMGYQPDTGAPQPVQSLRPATPAAAATPSAYTTEEDASYNQWLNKSGLERQDDILKKQHVSDSLENRSFLGEIATAPVRGLANAGEMALRALRTGQDKPGEDVGWLDTAATKGLNALDEYRAESPILQSKYEGGVKGAVSEGVSSVMTSIAAGAPAAAAGAGIASVVPIPGVSQLLGGIIGFALGAGGMFGLSQYDEVLERADKKGISRKESEPAAIWSGIHEGGWEFASDIVGAKLLGITGKALTPVAKQTLKQGIGGLFKKTWGQAAKQAGKVVGVETGSELMTAGFQSDIEKGIGLGDKTFWEGAKEAFGPAFVASVIFSGIGLGGASLRRTSIKRSLTNADAPIKNRMQAAAEVRDTLKETSPTVADVWFKNASESIKNGEAISLDAGGPTQLENFQQNQRKIYELGQKEELTPEEATELTNLQQEADWIKTTPEFKESRAQRVADLKEDLAALESTKNLSEADQKTMQNYRKELRDITDLSENERQFEADPLNAVNNEDFLEKFIQQGATRPEIGATEDQWGMYGEDQAKKGEILKKNKEDDPYWKVEEEKIQAQRDVKRVKDKLAVLNKRKNPTNKEIQQIATLEDELAGHNKKLSAAGEKTNQVESQTRENQRSIEREDHITQLEDTADKAGFSGPKKSAYVADKLKGYDAEVAQKRVVEEQVAPYFNKTPGSTTMRISDLKARNPITTKEDKAKLVRGQEKMAAAAAGTGTKRDPITIYTRSDGQTVVVNGNTTFNALQSMGNDFVAVEEQPTLLQPTENLDEIYAHAEASRGELKTLTESTAKQFGGEASFRPNNEVKDRARSEEKAKNYGTAGKLKDIIASTVSFKDEAQLRKALKSFDSENAVVELKNKFEKPMESGYRDISMTVQMPNGHFAEMQFTTDRMLKAKNAAGHKIYDLMREVETINRPSAKKAYKDLLKLSKDYYEAAYSGNLASDSALSLEMGMEVMRISKAIGDGAIGTLVSPSNLNSFSALSSQTKGTPSESKNFSDIKSPPGNNNVTPDKTDVKLTTDKITVPDIKVKVKYQHEKTGATVETTVSAREAMAELDTQEGILDKIINCMG